MYTAVLLAMCTFVSLAVLMNTSLMNLQCYISSFVGDFVPEMTNHSICCGLRILFIIIIVISITYVLYSFSARNCELCLF